MAFTDPRTGITTYEDDPAAAAEVAAAQPAPTGTALASAQPAVTSLDELWDRYTPGWQGNDLWGGARPAPGAEYDAYSMQWLGGRRPEFYATDAARAGNLGDWRFAVDQALRRTEYEDSYNMTGQRTVGGYEPHRYGTYGEDLILGPLDQIAGAAGLESIDWSPYLDEYWMSEWLDQIANQRSPFAIFSHGQGYGDTLLGVLDRAARGLGQPALAEIGQANLGPGTDFYRDYNTLGNWMESRRDEARNKQAIATMLPIVTGLLAPYIAPSVSEAAGGGLFGSAAAGAAIGGLQGLFTGDPIGGAVRGAFTAGVVPAAGEAFSDVWSSFNPDIVYAADPTLLSQGGTATTLMPAAVPEADPTFGGALSQIRPGVYSQFSSLMPPAIPETTVDLSAMGLTETAPGVFERLGAAGMIPSSSPSYDPAVAAPAPTVGPSAIDYATRVAKLAQALGGSPEGAPQRQEGQSDADYAQQLAAYVNVDARALADMGLVPGTPEYYEYLMSQMDAVVNDMTGSLNIDAADLQQQLRAKTAEEQMALRRALYVRGQLNQLMGSGTYTDPFTGISEEVITGGRQVNPALAAYQRGLGRTTESLAGMLPVERLRGIGQFTERETDPFGMQARADTRAEQEARYLAVLEDLKRRDGMFGRFGLGGISEAELAALLGL